MTGRRHTHANEFLDRRLDTLKLSASEKARALASLHTADLVVDAGFVLAAAMRSAAAFVARQFRAAFVSSTQH